MFGFGKKKEEMPVLDALFEAQITCDGQGYNSWKKPGTPRMIFLNRTKLGDPVFFEQMEYNGKPVFAVENKKRVDICCLPAPLSEYLVNMTDKLNIVGNLFYYNPPMVALRVFGKYKRDYPYYDGTAGECGKEYTYHIDNPDQKYFLLPAREVLCDLIECDEGYKVMFEEEVIGEIFDERKDNLKRMLKKNKCIVTILNEIHPYHSELLMKVRF